MPTISGSSGAIPGMICYDHQDGHASYTVEEGKLNAGTRLNYKMAEQRTIRVRAAKVPAAARVHLPVAAA